MVEKKDILDLNKKNWQTDEGEVHVDSKAGRFASKIAQITIASLLHINTRMRNDEAWWQLFTVFMALGFGDSLGRYRATKKKSYLIATILSGGVFFTLFIWSVYSYVNGTSMVPNIWIWKTH
jgi:hypothetical protein